MHPTRDDRRGSGLAGPDQREGDLSATANELRRSSYTRGAPDFPDRQSVEVRLRNAQRMEAAGRLLGGMGHELANLVTIIRACVKVGFRETPPDHPVRRLLSDIDGAVERAEKLTDRLFAFSGNETTSTKLVDLGDLVAGLAPMLRRAGGRGVSLQVSAVEGCLVRMNPGQLEQVVLNLALNAFDALPGEGTVHIRTLRREEEAERGEQVVLEVADDGTGMTPEVREQLFTPFFTTKEEGKGTGLGLAMTRGIVHEAGGSIEVDSHPGRGSIFRIHLPYSPLHSGAEADLRRA